MKLEEEKFSEAIQDFKKDLSLESGGPLIKSARVIDSLALAYYRSGDVEKAREEYERITSLTDGRLHLGDIYAKSFYMLGKIYEQQGQKAKAIEYYEEFLTLWKDSDPDISEVEDAKKRHYEEFLTLWKDSDPDISEVEDAKKRLATLQVR
jgi:tetratricopeptide (TPR) repeat protein